MEHEKTRKLLIEHYHRYPRLQIRDVFKFIYQSSFGCEHMVSSSAAVTDYIRREAESCADQAGPIDVLDGDYFRLHLCYLKQGLAAETLGKMFCASAKKEAEGLVALEQKLAVARQLTEHGELPFGVDELDRAATEWRQQGYPAVHHSETFREYYKPAYRVIAKKHLPFLPILAAIDRRAERGTVTVALEGGSASGKTTLGQMLSELYDCTVFHMDDFFLRPEQRMPERFAEAGGNVDRERFLEQVLLPHSRGESVDYCRFDCSTFTICPPVRVTPKPITIVEGAYSMHPELAPYYDLSVFLDIAPEAQKARIERRNSPMMAQRFFNEWIPMEQRYFDQMQVRARCDITISINE